MSPPLRAIAVLAVLIGCAHPTVAADSPTIKELASAAEATWERATNAAYTAEGSVVAISNGKQIANFTDAVKHDGVRCYFSRLMYDNSSGALLAGSGMAANEIYSFRVQKKPGETQWVISDRVEMVGEDGQRSKRPAAYTPKAYQHFANIAISDIPLYAILKSPATKVEGVTALDGGSISKIAFDYEQDSGPGRKERVTGTAEVHGTGYLKSADYKLSQYAKGNKLAEYNISTKNDCQNNGDIPVLREYVSVITPIVPLAADEGVTTRTGIIHISYGPVDEADFRLTAFGLPEVEGVEPVKKAMPLWVWLLIAAAVFALTAVALRIIMRRRASHTALQPTPPPAG